MADSRVCETCGETKNYRAFPAPKKAGGPKGNGRSYAASTCRLCVQADEAAKRPPPGPGLPSYGEIRAWYRAGCPL